MADMPVRKVTIFVSSPTDVMAERERAARAIDRLQSRFREQIRLKTIFFEEKYYTVNKTFQEQIPDAGESDLVISIFWSRLGSELPADVFGTMPDGRPYPGGAVYELMRALEARKRKELPDVLVYRKIADTGISVTDPHQRQLMNDQLDQFETFWRQWFVSQEGHFRAGFQTFHRPDDFELLFERHLRAWLEERGQLGKEVIWRIAERGSPFRGLEPYDAQHSEVFFGREREIDRGRERLLSAAARGTGFLLVVGPSGAGKSSLVRAGLATRLTQPGDIDGADQVRLAVVRPGSAVTPQRALAEALFEPEALPELAESDFPNTERLASALAAEATAAAAPILRSLERAAAKLKIAKSYDRQVKVQLLLVVDQLEELFSSTVTDANRLAFFGLIDALARSDQVLVTATMLSSAYGALAREPGLLALKDNGATLDVAVPGAEVLADIVRRPAEAAGLTFDRHGETGLDEVLLAAAGGKSDALPLLGFTLQWVFEHRDQERLTFAAYDQLGGLEGAIGRAAEQAFARLNHDSQAMLPRLLRGLAESSRQGSGLALRDMPLKEAPEGTPLRRLVDALIEVRIILVHGESAMVRLAHEAVLRGWDRARDITSKELDFFRIRQDVSLAGQRWRGQQQRRDLLLAPGLQLAEAQSLLSAYGPELSPEITDFISTSSTRERQRQRRGYVLAAVFGLAAVGAVCAGLFAWHQQRVAEEQTMLATAETVRAEHNLAEAQLTKSYFLADLATQHLSTADNSTAMSMALEALPDTSSGNKRPYVPEAERALFDGWQKLRETAIVDHDGAVLSATFSPDGRLVATASGDKTARILDAQTGRIITVLRGHDGIVLSAVFNQDGHRLITSSLDMTARVWDAENGRLLAVLGGQKSGLLSAAFSSDGRRILTASADGTVRIFDVDSLQVNAVLSGYEGRVSGAYISRDGKHAVTTSNDDDAARMWDVDKGVVVAVVREHADEIRSGRGDGAGVRAIFSADGRYVATSAGVTARIAETNTAKSVAVVQGRSTAFSPDSRRILTTSNDTARVWDVDSGNIVAILQGHEGTIRSAAFSADGLLILTASNDKTARIWDARSGRMLVTLRGHEAEVTDAIFSEDRHYVVTASTDRTARIWFVGYTTFDELDEHEERISSAVVSADGRRVVTASFDKTARIWDIETGKVLRILRGHEAVVWSASFSPDGRRIATASQDKTAQIWDAESGDLIAIMRGHDGDVRSAKFSKDGRLVITASDDHTARVWDATTGSLKTVLSEIDAKEHESDFDGRVSQASFGADGRRVVTATWNGTVRLWDSGTGKIVRTLHKPAIHGISHSGSGQYFPALPWTIKVSPDGHRLLTLTIGTPVIWDAESGDEILRLQQQAGVVRSADFSPDGLLVITSLGNTARIWNAKTGDQIAIFRDDEGDAGSATFSPDGRKVATVAGDKATRIWDVRTGKVIADIPDRAFLSFATDGKRIITLGDLTLGVWRIYAQTADLVDDAKRRVPRCLTREQRKRAFLALEPPAWCIEMEKWPYRSQAWKDWLRAKRVNENLPLPEASEWSALMAAKREDPYGFILRK